VPASHLRGPGSVLGPGKWFGGFDGHAMRLNSQAAMEDLSVSERFREVN